MTLNTRTMTLDDELPWTDLFAGRDDFYDDGGFAVTAETEDDHDLMMSNFIYMFRGGPQHPRSQWLGNGVVHNNLIVMTPRDRRGKGMYNNNFIRNGINQNSFRPFEALKIERTSDSVIWRIDDIVHTYAPPRWHLGGKSGGVEYDLHFEQLSAPVAWSYGTRQDAAKSGMGGGYCKLECEGSFKVGGHVYRIKRGRGIHERLVFSEKFDTIANVAIDTNGFGTGFSLQSLFGDVLIWGLGSHNDRRFSIDVAGDTIQFAPSEDGSTVIYRQLDPWHDPRSGLYLPSRWEIELTSTKGRLQAEVRGLGRGYYSWEMKHGTQIAYVHVCTLSGSFTHPDGRVVLIEEQVAKHQIVKNILVNEETLNGPILTKVF